MKKVLLLSAIAACLTVASYGQDAKTATPAPTASPSVQTTPAPENKNQAEFKFDEMEFNYGNIKQGDKVDHDFYFTNVGKEPLIITDARGSCGCTVPEWPKEPIKKGEKGKIHITFNSAGKMGLQDKTVTITSNAKTNPLVLHLKGNVEAAPAGAETKPADAH